jgi:hypothetical protein
MNEMDDKKYWYARGYHDGRVVGADVDDGIQAVPGDKYRDANRNAYKQGYDCGVTDYCEMDIEEDKA